MNCNIWGVTILLLVILVIGLLVFSQKKDRQYQLENFEITIPNTNPAATEPYVALEASNIIASNNDIITGYIDKIQNANPNVNIVNYQPDYSYQELGNAFVSNVNVINTSLAGLYSNTIGTNSTTNQLTKIEKTISDLENMTANLTNSLVKEQQYTRIKSLNNGMEMDLISTGNTHFQDERTGSNIAAYMVNVNKGCLSVGANDYDVYKCNDTNPKQYFKMEHIINEDAYQKAIDIALPFDGIDKSRINYPFVMMKSISNENCLTNNHGTLTVQPLSLIHI